ncbi:hypothetical protein [Thermosipho melanesiensis]|uniref:Uncharacterized protein n=1 Tax=Thermosipho melanesiensis TaxID=46541 RepID=A0ABN4UYD7_9BACT|nr:hypothetical protein [Thermosipho melanesiensis]APT74062.1 hypothetical protein BW47_05890 [Thermosipho melanesiensis]
MLNFNWDYCEGVETIIRKMVLGNLEDFKELLSKYSEKELKEIFLNNLHRFYGKDRSFWKVILEVSNEEIKRKSDESFRNTVTTRNFP